MNFKKFVASSLAVAIGLQPMLASAVGSQLSYNAANYLSQAVLPQGQTHQYAYNTQGSVVQHTLPNNATVGFARDGRGALSALTDPRGLATSYGVNGLGDVGSLSSPDTGSTSYTRDAAGRVTAVSDGRGTANFTWDAIGRMTAATYADASASFTYDTTQVGRLGLMQDASGSTSFSYDADGNISSRIQTTSGPTGGTGATLTLQQSFDGAGRLSQMTYPSGRVVTYTYDGARVASVAVDGTTVLSNVQYLPFGPPTSWQMGALGTYTRTYNTSGQMTAHTHESGQRTLTWDASNRVTGILNPGGAQWTYGYDSMDRLVSAVEGTQGTRAFAPDTNGNRTSTTINGTAYSYGVDGASNRLTTSTAPASAASYSYDAVGQLLGDGTRVFTWFKAGYLASAAGPLGTANYSYNGFGQRVKKVLGGGAQAVARHYLYADDGVSLLGEYSQAAGAGPVPLNETVYLEGMPVLVLTGGQVYFVQTDHLNTPRTIKNSAGAVVWRWESDAYGIGQASSNPGGLIQFEFNARFPGQQFDGETGLYYNNARYYDPVVGRYISSDPIGLAGGLNTYGYADSAPTHAIDPTGNVPLFVVTAAIGAVAGAGATISMQLATGQPLDWKAVGVASLTGGLAGALLPSVGRTRFGAAAVGSLANSTQTIATALVKCERVDAYDLLQSMILGAVAGAVAPLGPVSAAYKPNPRIAALLQPTPAAFEVAAQLKRATLINGLTLNLSSAAPLNLTMHKHWEKNRWNNLLVS